jgi:hypothetical protein
MQHVPERVADSPFAVEQLMEMRVPQATTFTVDQHFADRPRTVRNTYTAIVKAARKLGPVREEPKKTSIHLARKTAFAGVATRSAALILTLKSASDIASPRIRKREQASANRWHIEVELATPRDVDREVRGWLKRAYDLAG